MFEWMWTRCVLASVYLSFSVVCYRPHMSYTFFDESLELITCATPNAQLQTLCHKHAPRQWFPATCWARSTWRSMFPEACRDKCECRRETRSCTTPRAPNYQDRSRWTIGHVRCILHVHVDTWNYSRNSLRTCSMIQKTKQNAIESCPDFCIRCSGNLYALLYFHDSWKVLSRRHLMYAHTQTHTHTRTYINAVIRAYKLPPSLLCLKDQW